MQHTIEDSQAACLLKVWVALVIRHLLQHLVSNFLDDGLAGLERVVDIVEHR